MDGGFVREHPNALIKSQSYFIPKLGMFFLHDDILKVLLELDSLENVDVVINRKDSKEALIKILFRGGKIDDIDRAMILLP